MPDGSTRHPRANKIRKFIARVQGVGVANEHDKDFGPIERMPNQISEPTLPSQRINLQQLEHLSPKQCTRLLAVLDKFADCITDTAKHCTLIPYKIRVSDSFQLKASKAYRDPKLLKEKIERQVADLLKLGFIRTSRSQMSSGVVCVVKPDKSIILKGDCRYLNSHTIGDNFPMPNFTEVMHQVGKARWITVCDATSG